MSTHVQENNNTDDMAALDAVLARLEALTAIEAHNRSDAHERLLDVVTWFEARAEQVLSVADAQQSSEGEPGGPAASIQHGPHDHVDREQEHVDRKQDTKLQPTSSGDHVSGGDQPSMAKGDQAAAAQHDGVAAAGPRAKQHTCCVLL